MSHQSVGSIRNLPRSSKLTYGGPGFNLLPNDPDPRTKGLPLMDSWWPTVIISILYVVVVWLWRHILIKKQRKETKGGKVVGKVKKPDGLHVKFTLVLYNAAMVLYNAYVLKECLAVVYSLGYGLRCTDYTYKDTPDYRRLVNLGWFFYFSKIIEFMDTMFFLWRGKVDQVTFLHVFHHANMPPAVWLGLRYLPEGMIYMFPMLNSFIHVLMYSYYGLAAAGAHKYLWWKSYLTLAQMIQFVILILHQSQVFIYPDACDYPKTFPAAICLYSIIFLILFSNFYIQAYWKQRRQPKLVAAKAGVANGHTNVGIEHTNGYLANGTTNLSKKVKTKKSD